MCPHSAYTSPGTQLAPGGTYSYLLNDLDNITVSMLLYCRKAPSLKNVFVLIGLTRCPETLCLVTSTLLCLASSSTLGYWSLVHCFHHEVCVCVSDS